MKKIIISALLVAATVLSTTGCNNGIREFSFVSTAPTTTAATTTVDKPVRPVTTPIVTTTVAATTTTPTDTANKPVDTTSEPDDHSACVDYHKVAIGAGKTSCFICGERLTSGGTASASISKPTAITKPTETTKPVEATTTAKPTETTTPVESFKDSNELSEIKKICGLKSDVETNIKPCAVDVFDEHNPYDVVYNYGENYNAFVDACDWDLVFDADYYIEQFPMLATLYHNDKALLLEHFQTVGIHEGRQGCANFNVGAYKANCDSDIRNAFGNNYEGYYFYYMLNYKTEKSVKTIGSDYEIQYNQIMTKCQADELAGVNNYRDEVNVADIAFNSELAALANYRAWTNAHDDWRGHDWLRENENYIREISRDFDATCFGENTAYYLNFCKPYGDTFYDNYRKSQSHYEAMIAAKYDIIGLSNVYYSWEDTFTNHFQAFLDL